jgi:hypothetical protein
VRYGADGDVTEREGGRAGAVRRAAGEPWITAIAEIVPVDA